MALNVSASATRVNGQLTPSPAEDEDLYTELLRIRDAVIANEHAHFRLPQAAIEHLKANAQIRVHEPSKLAATADSSAIRSSTSTDHSQSSYTTPPVQSHAGLPGLHASTNGITPQPSTKPVPQTGLDPIFLEKSDNLVRAEGLLKRQRIERELQAQVECRRQLARDRDPGMDAPSATDVEAMLALSAAHVKHVSGLRAAARPDSPASSSFDENDYYSSQVQSEWSSDASPSKNSDRATGAFTADFERLDEPDASLAAAAPNGSATGSHVPPARKPEDQHQAPAFEVDDEYDPEEMDDEYTPPAASAFEPPNGPAQDVSVQPATSEEDNSEYEPGEVPSTGVWPTEHRGNYLAARNSPQVPVIRNHLTHIAAPQPSRVSPLAVAKRPSIELELVNGRPEVVQRPRQDMADPVSRPSSASRSGNNAGSLNKKMSKKAKKRKRREEAEAQRAKKKRNQETAPNPPTFAYAEPLIKDEPVSTPPLLASIQEARYPYERPQIFPESQPVQINLLSPRQQPQGHYDAEVRRRAKRLEAIQTEPMSSQATGSPRALRPAPRDSQDLRRVASLQYAQIPRSPAQHGHPPQRTASLAYGEYSTPPLGSYQAAEPEAPRYREQPVRYVRVGRSPSPPRLHDYQELYARPAQTPALVQPQAPAPLRIVVDQWGTRYYAAEAEPQAVARASVAPVERRPRTDYDFERAPSRTQTAYAPRYESTESRMAPPPTPWGRRVSDENRMYQTDLTGYQARDRGASHVEPVRYMEQTRSPVYQQSLGYETMPPPPAPMPPSARERTPPVYASRAYSVRPEEATPFAHTYIPRQASVAPVQYVRQEVPPANRALSVMPGFESSVPAPYRVHGHAQQPVRYVDQLGQEVYPQEVRHVSEYRY